MRTAVGPIYMVPRNSVCVILILIVLVYNKVVSDVRDTANNQIAGITLGQYDNDSRSFVRVRGGLQPPIASESVSRPLLSYECTLWQL